MCLQPKSEFQGTFGVRLKDQLYRRPPWAPLETNLAPCGMGPNSEFPCVELKTYFVVLQYIRKIDFLFRFTIYSQDRIPYSIWFRNTLVCAFLF
jgi:hypothetical protein